jgi:nucleoside-diphosphate-sugar epimerase
MRVLITGAAGNLGSSLARALQGSPHELRLMIHRQPLPSDLESLPNSQPFPADLDDRRTLVAACRGADCIVHFAGVLFRPFPERFLPTTNTAYTRNLVDVAIAEGVKKFILISFPHVEGVTTPDQPATGRLDGSPESVHAKTRLEAEKYLIDRCAESEMRPVILRAGMIYSRGVLMIDAARSLSARSILPVWPEPTWIHLLSLPDFEECVITAIKDSDVQGIYPMGDEAPLTLQEFLDRATAHWGHRSPRRLPKWSFFFAAALVELYATVFNKPAPLTRDFIRIGMASYVSDTTRMRSQLLTELAYPTLKEGLELI